MDLLYSTGFGLNVNNNNSYLGGYYGLKLKEDKFSIGGDVGLEVGLRDACSTALRGNVAYNSDEVDGYDEGFFAKADAKLTTTIDPGYALTTSPTGFGFNGNVEAGYRFDSSLPYCHSNVSLFGEYDSYNLNSSKILGAKYELSDGNRAVFGAAGAMFTDSGVAPYVGIGGRLALNF